MPHPSQAFVPTPVPTRRFLATACTSTSSEEIDQFDQYAARDRKALTRELDIVRALPKRQRHHQIFLHPESERPFRSAASRYIASLDERMERPERLWLLHSRSDPTFGRRRAAPIPARVMLMEVGGGEGLGVWLEALGRAGKVLSPYPSYHVDWAVVGQHGETDGVKGDELVACEVLNANWVKADSVENMKLKMLEHGEKLVRAGKVRVYEVLQSLNEPTCFKSVEVYEDIEQLERQMAETDQPFAEGIMKWRAAVNRVRQLYEPLFGAG
eukprot:GFKZ01004218.1.p1 GENE.GFKZ01004218.1~~GFKZ01004218.1.p1  ORF type:complete len:270 (+),score=31.65 GFKZ01004218.1:143-952(+)